MIVLILLYIVKLYGFKYFIKYLWLNVCVNNFGLLVLVKVKFKKNNVIEVVIMIGINFLLNVFVFNYFVLNIKMNK